MGLIVYSTRLFDILEDVLAGFYTGGSKLITTPEARDLEARDMTKKIQALDDRLDAFFDTIPAYLRSGMQTNPESGPNPPLTGVQMQARVLYCRYVVF